MKASILKNITVKQVLLISALATVLIMLIASMSAFLPEAVDW